MKTRKRSSVQTILENFNKSVRSKKATSIRTSVLTPKTNYKVPTDSNISLNNILSTKNTLAAKTPDRKSVTFMRNPPRKGSIFSESPKFIFGSEVNNTPGRRSQVVQLKKKVDIPKINFSMRQEGSKADSSVVSLGFKADSVIDPEVKAKRKATFNAFVEGSLLESTFGRSAKGKAPKSRLSMDFLKLSMQVQKKSKKPKKKVKIIKKKVAQEWNDSKLPENKAKAYGKHLAKKSTEMSPKKVKKLVVEAENSESESEVIDLQIPEEHRNINFFRQQEECGSFYDKVLTKYLFDNNGTANDRIAKQIIIQDIKLLDREKEETLKIKEVVDKERSNVEEDIKEFDSFRESRLSRVNSEKSVELSSLKDKFLSSKKRKGSVSSSEQGDDQKMFNLKERQMKKKEEKELKEVKELINKVICLDEAKEKFVKDSAIKLLKEDVLKLFDDVKMEGEIAKNYDFEDNNLLNRSLIADIEQFQEEDLTKYSSEVPEKYCLDTVRLVTEQTVGNKTTKVYENGIVELRINGAISREYPDGYKQMTFRNNDFRQTFPDGTVISTFYKSKSTEFVIPGADYKVYLYSTGQLEKHFSSGIKQIRFADGGSSIIRPNGEEVNVEPTGKIHLKMKTGDVKIFFKKT